jgi:hypothetical protein
MITAIQSKILVRFAIEMKNFIPRWLHFIPRFPQIKCTLEMCHSRRAAGHCCSGLAKAPRCSAKVSKYSLRKVLNCERSTFVNI